MANGYFNHVLNRVQNGIRALGGHVNNPLDEVAVGFDKLPDETAIKEGRVQYAVDTGVDNAFVVEMPYAFTLTDGAQINFKAANANPGGICTINPNALGATAIVWPDGNELPVNSIVATQQVSLRYEAQIGKFQMLSASHLTAVDAVATAADAVATAADAVATAADAVTTNANAQATANDAETTRENALNTSEWASEFGKQYLGSKKIPPTVDNQGQPLTTGALYFLEANNRPYVYDGSTWLELSDGGGAQSVEYIATGDGVQTVFTSTDFAPNTLAYTVGLGMLLIFIDGVKQYNSDFVETSSTTITFNEAPPPGSVIEVLRRDTIGSALLGNVSEFMGLGNGSKVLFSDVDFTPAGLLYEPGAVEVFIDGIRIANDEWEESSPTSITFAAAPANGSNVTVLILPMLHVTDAVTTAGGQTINGDLAVIGKLGIGTNDPTYNFVVSNYGNEGIEFLPAAFDNTSDILAYNRTAEMCNDLRVRADSIHFITSNTPAVALTLDPSQNAAFAGAVDIKKNTPNSSYNNSQLSITTTDGSEASLAFNRAGFTACQLRHAGDGLSLSGVTRTTPASLHLNGGTLTAGVGEFAGTVNGRDIAVDGAKLDTILEEGNWTPEEGNWTPIVGNAGSAGNPIGVNRYTKIGRQVTVQVQFQFTARANRSTSALFFSGLPFASALPISSAGSFVIFDRLAGPSGLVSIGVSGSTFSISDDVTDLSTNLAANMPKAGSTLYATLTYFTA